MIKVIIADDHKLIRNGIKKLFENEVDIEVVAETGNPFKIINLIEKYNCDILLLDLIFPEKRGMEILKDIKIQKPETKVLVISIYAEDLYALRVLKSKAEGYISKDDDPLKILEAVRIIHAGHKYYSQNVYDELLELNISDMKKTAHSNLSDREFQVFMLLASGKSQTEIGDLLSLSLSTINTYRARVLQKLGLNSTAELIKYAYENKLQN